jgi:hypothetical protein
MGYLSAQDIQALHRNEDWNPWESRNAQVAFLSTYAEIDFGVKFPRGMLTNAFDLISFSVCTIYPKSTKRNVLPIVHSASSMNTKKQEAKWPEAAPWLEIIWCKGRYLVSRKN